MKLHIHDYRHSQRSRRILAGLIPVVCPPEARELGLEQAIVDHVELSMRAVPVPVRAGLVSGLGAYDLGALVRHGKRSYRLDHDARERYFAAWWHGRALMREFARGIKGLLCLAHYEMPAVQARLGYAPQAWIDTVKRRRLSSYGDDIRRHQDRLVAPDPLPASLSGTPAPGNETPGDKALP